jgi:hypothetical protein
MDLSGLIKGIMVVIGIAMATGHYGDLERWARQQAIEALQWKEPLPYFFPNHSQIAQIPNVPQKRAKIDK